jgi:hypothetical protein
MIPSKDQPPTQENTSMDENVFSPDPNHSQPDGCGLDRSSEIIKSPWPPDGVNRVLKALNKIGGEWAEADAASRATVPPPAIISSSDCDVADAPPPCFEAAPVSPDVTGNAIASDKRGLNIIKNILRPFFRTQEPRGAPRPKCAVAKPVARPPARSRSTHSHVSYGGARKAGDPHSGAGTSDGDGPTPSPVPLRTYRQCVTLEPDGGVTLEEDGNLIAEFDNIGGAVRWLFEFEDWARSQDTWDGRSFRDKDHPLYPVIRWGMKWLDDPRSAGPAPRPKKRRAA